MRILSGTTKFNGVRTLQSYNVDVVDADIEFAKCSRSIAYNPCR